jgi:aspartyl-tRNA(Asn)/glutamyl-tRNA(Gln) amidotransferase subunit A
MTDVARLSAVAMADLIRRGEVTPTECTVAVLNRMVEWIPALNPFVDFDPEGALIQARAATDALMHGAEVGPLHGVPVTIKNIQAVRGFPTLRGSRLASTEPAPADAPLVSRLRKAGAIVVGTTTMPEQAWTATSDSTLTGTTHNPWLLGRTAGGSSSGAASLAGAGCGPLHLGTDGAGSIRVPAHFCGAVGFKPSYGRIPYVPVPNNASLSHAGPITRSVRDAALMTSVMSGPHKHDLTTLPGAFPAAVPGGDLNGIRIAFSPDLGHARVDPEVARIVGRAMSAFTAAGATVEIATPAWGPEGPDVIRALWGLDVLGFLPRDDATAAQMDPGLVACTREFQGLTAQDGLAATGRRLAYAAEINAWFPDEGWDVLVTPSASVTAFPVGRLQPESWPQHPWDWISWAEFSYPFNCSHGPAISVPCGLSNEGLPVGLQIAGPRLSDEMVLRVAAAFLEVQPFNEWPTPPGDDVRMALETAEDEAA